MPGFINLINNLGDAIGVKQYIYLLVSSELKKASRNAIDENKILKNIFKISFNCENTCTIQQINTLDILTYMILLFWQIQ